MKDFFLLARGDLYLMFVDIANPFMCQSPTKSIERGESQLPVYW